MAKKHHHLEKEIILHFASTHANVIFESEADIQGFDNNGCKVIGEFKSESEHKKNYSWWSYWKGRLEPTYSIRFSTMQPKNKRWIAVVDGQLRDYCQLDNTNTGYLVVENYAQINTDITDALQFLISEGKINCFSGPTNDSQGVGYYRITY
jgi:redox-sensitive bicupin YhaK (pirin superfamily)